MTEFEFIDHLKVKYHLTSIGDDCAVLPKDAENDLLVTTDMLVEDVDFRLAWTTPAFLGHKVLAVSLSDIAAMGGVPEWALTSIAIPEKLWKSDLLDQFYCGWHQLAEHHHVQLIGGDISKTDGKLTIDSTMLGSVPTGKAVLRAGARPGDAIFVTGYLGGAAAGLKLLESGTRFDDDLPAPVKHLLFRQLQPLPQIKTAILLQTQSIATSMIDISDGLSSDISHIAKASGVGARLDRRQIPIDPAIGSVFPDQSENIDLALHGGEDFELLITVAEKNFSAVADLGFHHIGEITANRGVIELSDGAGTVPLDAKGYTHF